MNKIYILFLCLCYAVSAIMANTYKNDKEVTSPTDANIFGHVVDKATGEHLPGITIILKGTTIGSVAKVKAEALENKPTPPGIIC